MADLVLVPGFWLGGWAWDEVGAPLREAGHRVWQVTLPGLESAGADRSHVTLDDHIRAVVDVLESNDIRHGVLVGHSGAGSVIYGTADRAPGRLATAVYVDSGPLPDGVAQRPDLAADIEETELPPWDVIAAAGTSLEGLTPGMLETIRARAVPEPAGPQREPLHVTNPARLDVPVVLVNCSMPTSQVVELMNAGNPWFVELASLQVTHVELPTGHWPMFSRPADLAKVLEEIAQGRPSRRRRGDAGGAATPS